MPSTSKISTSDLTVVRLLVLNRALGSALGLLLGVSILAGTNLLGVLDIPVDFSVAQGLFGTLLALRFVYITLAFAKKAGDPQIKSPIRWVLAFLIPLFNIYMAFSILPRVFSGWLKGTLDISVSETAVRLFSVITTCMSLFGQAVASATGISSLLAWYFLFDGAIGLLAVWALRRALYPQASK
jgi:hypothetical protein